MLNFWILSLPRNNKAASKGEWLFKEILGVELMWEAIKLQSSWVRLAKEVPLGRIYLIYSWFFSIEPFCQEQEGSQ